MSSISQGNVLIQAAKDPWTIVASSGATVLLTVDWIVSHVSPVVGLIGATGGLVAITFSIIQKRREARAAAVVLMMREVELKRLLREINEQNGEIEKEHLDV